MVKEERQQKSSAGQHRGHERQRGGLCFRQPGLVQAFRRLPFAANDQPGHHRPRLHGPQAEQHGEL